MINIKCRGIRGFGCESENVVARLKDPIICFRKNGGIEILTNRGYLDRLIQN